MATSWEISCQKRILGKESPKSLRKQGMVPAIIYGPGFPNLPVKFDRAEIGAAFRKHGARGLYSLKIKDEPNTILALVREVQRNHITKEIIHIDFMKVNTEEKITAVVPVVLNGEELWTHGGILQSAVKEVEVECLPGDLPERINVDVSNAQIGDKITLQDLDVPPGVKLTGDPETVVAVILAPAKEEPAVEPGTEAEGQGQEES